MQDSHSVPKSRATSEPEELWTNIEGVRMRYLRAGSGPPLVLLHGLLGYSFSWRFNMPALARHRTVYAVDMPGAGFSQRCPDMDCSFHGAAVRLLNFARNVGLGPFELLGTSHGGAVAMMAAALAPGSVRRLLLVAPVNPWSSHGRRRSAVLSHPLMRPLLLRIAPHLRFAHSFFLRRVYQDSSRIPPGAVEGYSAPFALAGTFEHKLAMLASWNQDVSELRRILPVIANIPTLLLWGSKDPAVDPASLPVLARQFRNCTTVVLDDVGHLPYEEAPQEFNAAIIRFLTAGFADGDTSASDARESRL